MIYKLENTVQHYSWGSAAAIPEFLGRAADGRPWAELWMGAHISAPSRVVTPDGPVSLSGLISSDPGAVLGRACLQKFGPKLPYLFKVLAAAEPLSIQCHPDRERARQGFAKENSLGLKHDDPKRNYRDDNHKPEVILAVSNFTALRGFRDPEETAEYFSSLGVRELADAASSALAHGAAGYIPLLETLLRAPKSRAAGWIASRRKILEADPGWSPQDAAGGCSPPRASLGNSPEDKCFLRLSGLYPGDPGCFAPYYLNLVELKPGEALFLGAGVLHAYLEGTGVELMANSDNVLRGGLTAKHMDVDELISLLVTEAGRARVLVPRHQAIGGGITEDVYPGEAEEFALSVLSSSSRGRADLPGGSPEILLCGEGSADISVPGVKLSLAKGESAFISAENKSFTLEGSSFRVYRARVPA